MLLHQYQSVTCDKALKMLVSFRCGCCRNVMFPVERGQPCWRLNDTRIEECHYLPAVACELEGSFAVTFPIRVLQTFTILSAEARLWAG
jgi:hypothetical protein